MVRETRKDKLMRIKRQIQEHLALRVRNKLKELEVKQ